MKYSVVEMHGTVPYYVTTGSGNWLDLLNDTSRNKKDAYTYPTRKAATEGMYKFIRDAGKMYNGLLAVKGIRE